jgi:hypothetical protein
MGAAINGNEGRAFFPKRHYISTKLHGVTHSSILKMDAERSTGTYLPNYTESHRLNKNTNESDDSM